MRLDLKVFTLGASRAAAGSIFHSLTDLRYKEYWYQILLKEGGVIT